MTSSLLWSPPAFCLEHNNGIIENSFADTVYQRVCRSDFDAPGFCLIDLGRDANSQSLRQSMVKLKHELREIHHDRRDRDLAYISMARFDQQVTTKPHRDGGPEQSLLILGYEPTDIQATIAISDYSRCAFDLGLTPEEFLDQHNPMFASGQEMLRLYTISVSCFRYDTFQILVINNSIAPFATNDNNWQGVLHTATVLNPDDSKSRVVNSTMVASVARNTLESISADDQEEFLTTDQVRRRNYE